MKTIFDPAIEREVLRRLDKLTPGTPHLWGKMNASQMVCHLVDGFHVGLGDVPVDFRQSFASTPLIRWLVVNLMPIPKGKIQTSKEYQVTKPASWTNDLDRWKALFREFVERGRSHSEQWGMHPAFGSLDRTQWGRLTFRHIDHHLRQFGV